MIQNIEQKIQQLPSISLEDMSSIKLMHRTDTKFVATYSQLLYFLSAIKGMYFIQEIEGKRIASYRTTYLDTPGNDMYLMHHNQKAAREKIRVRTYIDSNLTFLEVKNKNNHGRTNKKRITVEALENLAMEKAQIAPFLDKYAWYTLDDIIPVIENRFSRITLVNYEKTERLTIDFLLTFNHLVTGCVKKLSQTVILELKRDGYVGSHALDIFRELRIQKSGFSKYCIGCALTNEALRRNNFKSRLKFIERLESTQI